MIRALIYSLAAVLLVPLIGQSSATTLSAYPTQPAEVAWPTDEWQTGILPSNMDHALLEKELDHIWSQPTGLSQTRAVLLIHKGKLVYERYQDGVDENTRFISWSMAKSITSILAGIMARDGKLELDQPARVASWRDASDPRSKITLRHLLNMTPGQELVEDGDRLQTSTVKMLFSDNIDDMVGFAASLPAKHQPGTVWEYTTPGSTLIAGLVGDAVTDERDPMKRRDLINDFIQKELTGVIGAQSFVGEYDGAGNFLGGSHAYMTARDWARFGYLLLRGGNWNGHQVVTKDWLDFVRTPAPVESNGTHGAHFWIKGKPVGTQWLTYLDMVPDDVFAAHGNEGQYVSIIPSLDLVVVRLGVTDNKHKDELARSLSTLIASFKP